MQAPWTEFGSVLQAGKTSEQHLNCSNFFRTGPDFNDDKNFPTLSKFPKKSIAATKGIELYRSYILFYICGWFSKSTSRIWILEFVDPQVKW